VGAWRLRYPDLISAIEAKEVVMRAKLLNENGERMFAVIFETGDDPVAGLTRFAEERKLGASAFTAIGAFSEATLGYFDWDKKDYERIPVKEQVEVLALVGDIALQDGKPKLHAHVVLGRRDGNACGGHLLEARVRPTLEVIVTEAPAHLRRRHDPASGLALIEI
jgi:predicted DNA-binding protein with PD1-like motif